MIRRETARQQNVSSRRSTPCGVWYGWLPGTGSAYIEGIFLPYTNVAMDSSQI
jgi:hypothetical protein